LRPSTAHGMTQTFLLQQGNNSLSEMWHAVTCDYAGLHGSMSLDHICFAGWRTDHTVTCNIVSSRPIKTDEIQHHGWTPTCTSSHSEDKQLFTSSQSARWFCCCKRSSALKGFMLLQKVWAASCALPFRQAQSTEQALHVSNCRNGCCDLCGPT